MTSHVLLPGMMRDERLFVPRIIELFKKREIHFAKISEENEVEFNDRTEISELRKGDGHKDGRGRDLLGAAMEDLGIEKADIATGIRNGATLAEVAESNGISSDDLISTITSIMAEKLNEAVAEGKITADEALAKADNIQERAQQLINKPLDQKPGKGHNHRG